MRLYDLCKTVAITAVFVILAPSCIFDLNTATTSLTMTYLGTQRDTLSPEPTLRFVFSSPLNSPLDFNFSPSVGQPYSITFDTAHDTASLSFLEPLPPDTRFSLTLTSSLTARDGSTLAPGNDSAVFITGHGETEPNNKPDFADTVSSYVYGFLSTSQDSDFYCVPKKHASYYCIASDNTVFSVFDSLFNHVQTISIGNDSNAFTVPDTTRYPLTVCIYSSVKGILGNYKFGILKQ